MSYHREAVDFGVAIVVAALGFLLMFKGPLNMIVGLVMVFLAVEMLGPEPKPKKRKVK